MTGPHLATRAGAVISRRRNAPSGEPGSTPDIARSSWGTRATRLLGRHWLLVVLLAAGLALRIAAQIAYQPALIYVDTLKYLYGASPGADPLGYTLVLRAILVFGGLSLVALAQHVLGLALAVALYAVLLRRGANRWLAAVAVAPVLLDAYQVQIEQNIMPDVWFEALIVAGLALLLWRPSVTVRLAAAAGLILGLSATVHQVGELLIVPVVVYLLVAAGHVRRAVTTVVAAVVAFALPVVLYCGANYVKNGHFWLARSQSTAGRVVAAADCATLTLPPAVRPLCPTPAEQAKGPDWLKTSKYSPLHAAPIPAGANRARLISELTSAIKSQQPERILGGIVRDSVRLFAVTRTPNPWVTPLSRWQFQTHYPTYPHWVTLGPGNVIVVGVQYVAFGKFHFSNLKPAYGGKAQVDRPVAGFLRSYQLNGGFTPGPFLLLCTAVGVLGSAAGRRPAGRPGPRVRPGIPRGPGPAAGPGLPAVHGHGRGAAAGPGPGRVLLAVPVARRDHPPARRDPRPFRAAGPAPGPGRSRRRPRRWTNQRTPRSQAALLAQAALRTRPAPPSQPALKRPAQPGSEPEPGRSRAGPAGA